jgi:hypothetical protein
MEMLWSVTPIPMIRPFTLGKPVLLPPDGQIEISLVCETAHKSSSQSEVLQLATDLMEQSGLIEWPSTNHDDDIERLSL